MTALAPPIVPDMKPPYYDRSGVTIHQGDCLDVLRELPSESVNCCVTSPPYWGLRDYGVDGQLGLESTPAEFVAAMVEVFDEVRRVLRDDGTLWLNLGDSYGSGGDTHTGFNQRWSGTGGEGSKQDAMLDGVRGRKSETRLKPKNLIGIPWRVAFALQEAGWYLRQDIIWHKPNPMPESVTDRCTKSHEYIFLLSKSQRYFYDHHAISEPCFESNDARPRMGQGPNTQYNQKRDSWAGSKFTTGKTAAHQGGRAQSEESRRESKKRGEFNGKTEALRVQGRNAFRAVTEKRNKRSVWTVSTKPYKEAHFAVFPPDLIEPCILAGCPERGTVLDPFIGSGTTAQVAKYNGRQCIGIELNPDYCALIPKRIAQDTLF